jgi:hypothetical protein
MATFQVTRYVGYSIGSALTVVLLRAYGGNGVPAAGAYASAFQVGALLCLLTGAVAWALHGRPDRAGSGLDSPGRPDHDREGQASPAASAPRASRSPSPDPAASRSASTMRHNRLVTSEEPGPVEPDDP